MYNVDNLKKLDCLNSYRICLANMYIEMSELALFPNNNCDRSVFTLKLLYSVRGCRLNALWQFYILKLYRCEIK